jgi:hypothetical protein
VLTSLLSFTVRPPAVPFTDAVFVTKDGLQSRLAVVRLEQAYVQVSPGSSVPGEPSGPELEALSTSAGGSSQSRSTTTTAEAGNGSSPGLVTNRV